jgi:hypothetical protein
VHDQMSLTSSDAMSESERHSNGSVLANTGARSNQEGGAVQVVWGPTIDHRTTRARLRANAAAHGRPEQRAGLADSEWLRGCALDMGRAWAGDELPT